MEKEIKQQEEEEESVGGAEEKRAESLCIGRGGGRRVCRSQGKGRKKRGRRSSE